VEAQRKAVRDYLDGDNWQLIGEYTKVESGKRSDRPELERRPLPARSIGRGLSSPSSIACRATWPSFPR